MACRFPEHHGSGHGGGAPLGALLAALAAAAVAGPVLAAVAAGLDAVAWLAWVIAIGGSLVTAALAFVVVAGTVEVKRAERAWRRSTRATERLAVSLSRVPVAQVAPPAPPRQALGPARPAPEVLTGRVVPRGEVAG